jgi:hypothetical protein
MKRTGYLLALALLPLAALAQDARIKMPDFSALAEKATKSVDISLDKDMLKNAAAFMGGGDGSADPEFAAAIKGLEGIYVKAFNFDKPDMYSRKDIDALARQVEGKGWKKLISVQDKGERVDMWMRDNSTDGGMFMIAAKPMELVLVNIAGSVNLESMRKLQGRMGVPAMPGGMGPPSGAMGPMQGGMGPMQGGMGPRPPAPPGPPAR